jgi:histone H1/5
LSDSDVRLKQQVVNMSTDTAAVTQVVAGDAKQKIQKKKVAGKSAMAKKTAEHPKYSEMVHQALTNLRERGGSSRQAVLKYIVKNFNVGTDENVVNTHLKMALKAGVKNASLKQSKGSGAAGSFRIGEVHKPKVGTSKKSKVAAGIKSVAKKPKATKSPKKPKVAAGKKPSMQKKSTVGGVKKADKKTVKKPVAAGQKAKKVQKAKKATSPVKKSVKQAAVVKKTPVKSNTAAAGKKTAATTAKKA